LKVVEDQGQLPMLLTDLQASTNVVVVQFSVNNSVIHGSADLINQKPAEMKLRQQCKSYGGYET